MNYYPGTYIKGSLVRGIKPFGQALTSKTADYTVTANDEIILVDSSGGLVTLTLPAVSGLSGKTYTIVKTDAAAIAVVIDGNSAELISGQLTQAIQEQFGVMRIICDGTAWYII